MANPFDDFIRRAESILPELCSTKDLVNLGIYKSEQAAAYARRKGYSPEFFQFASRTVKYPKDAVLKFLKNAHRKNENSATGNTHS